MFYRPIKVISGSWEVSNVILLHTLNSFFIMSYFACSIINNIQTHSALCIVMNQFRWVYKKNYAPFFTGG